jgi:hypothetical protein
LGKTTLELVVLFATALALITGCKQKSPETSNSPGIAANKEAKPTADATTVTKANADAVKDAPTEAKVDAKVDAKVEGKPDASGSDQFAIELKLEKGQTFKQEFVTDQKVTQSLGGVEQKVDQTMTFGMLLNVEEVDAEGIMKVNMKYESVRMEVKGAMGDIGYNSENPPETIHPAMQGFSTLVGLNFTVRFDKNATIKEVIGSDAMIETIVKKLGPQAGMQADLEKGLQRQFGEEGIKNMLSPTTGFYPGKPVRLGEAWSKVFTVTSGFPHTQDNTYTLTSQENGRFHIGMVSKLSPLKDGEPLEMGPMKLEMNLSGTQKGTVQVDEKTGLAMGMDLDQDLAGNANMLGAPGGGGGMKIPMTVKSKIKIVTK